jgi:hypothetical protein
MYDVAWHYQEQVPDFLQQCMMWHGIIKNRFLTSYSNVMMWHGIIKNRFLTSYSNVHCALFKYLGCSDPFILAGHYRELPINSEI